MVSFQRMRKVVAPKDNPKESNAVVIEDKRGVMFKKFISIQIQHGDDVHVLDANFPMSNLTRFSSKAADFFAENPKATTYTIKASAKLPYDSMPYHRVIDLMRRTDTSSNPGRRDVNLKVTGLTLSQITQAFWFCQVLDLKKPLEQDWIGNHIIEQFPKDQGVAQLDVAALRTILTLCSPEGKVNPAARLSMKGKIRQNRLSAAELVELAVLRSDFPQFAAEFGGSAVAAGPAQAAPTLQVVPNRGPLTAPGPPQSPAQMRPLNDVDFPPLGGPRR
ncbi:hypothetical protein BLS_009567 [Venturia inaequalis]|uniref:Uncharacterized protein n=1 Tax=Venturia inaequalis TaxID=5025 RepID=A0A8H3U513_VENIN|nr:hypothetical protein BLS_009567 [Venturia inaequalis]